MPVALKLVAGHDLRWMDALGKRASVDCLLGHSWLQKVEVQEAGIQVLYDRCLQTKQSRCYVQSTHRRKIICISYLLEYHQAVLPSCP